MFCFALLSIFNASSQIIKFSDPNFKRELLTQGFDLNNNSEIEISEAEKIDVLYVKNQGIESINGIEHFKNLKEFGCYYNKIKTLDLTALTKLQYLYAGNNELDKVNIDGLKMLKHIFLQNNPNLYINIDFKQYTDLEEIWVDNTRCPTLDVSHLKSLKEIHATDCQLKQINIDSCINLKSLWLDKNQLIQANFKQLENIEFITLSYNPINRVDIKFLKSLVHFSCLDCSRLKQINTSGCENLKPILW